MEDWCTCVRENPPADENFLSNTTLTNEVVFLFEVRAFAKKK